VEGVFAAFLGGRGGGVFDLLTFPLGGRGGGVFDLLTFPLGGRGGGVFPNLTCSLGEHSGVSMSESERTMLILLVIELIMFFVD